MSSLTLEELPEVVADLMGERPREVVKLSGGGNNLVARADLRGGPVLVKAYFHHAADPRDRLRSEYLLLSHLWRLGWRAVPEPLQADFARHVGIYAWVAGERAAPDSLTRADAQALAQLLGAMWRLKDEPGAAELPLASEATFSARELLEVLSRRRQRLFDQVPDEGEGAQALRFLREELGPTLAEVEARLADVLDLDAVLPPAERTLSPSDIGFHNALRTPAGWVFLDFEYGGWDDPAKAMADGCLSPAVRLPGELRGVFVDATLERLGRPAGLAARFELLYPLFALKWCLILLNEFLPLGRERRERATGAAQDGARRLAQLSHARSRLEELRANSPLLTPYL